VNNETSVDLWRRCAAGDEDAAEQIYRRYAAGLMTLARRRLSARLARRVDPEDVVQSAYRSFFLRGREGQFRIERSGDLWRLLTTITVKKLLGQVEFHQAQQRDFQREWAPGEASPRTGVPPTDGRRSGRGAR
jgi:DNA-directed RNA polymerase specialized sigma24 family protein